MVGGEVLRLDEHRPQRVRQDLAAAPDRLQHGAAHVLALEARRDVGVDPVDALPLVVLEVVAAEGDAVGDADGPVGHHCEQSVRLRALEEEVVRQLVDREEERLRDGGAKDVGDE
eukprot:scaffold39923_cov64-Phaeocystis_antarctica.AAC.1